MFLPTNQTTWLNCWTPLDRWQNILKDHISIANLTLMTIATTTPVQITIPTPTQTDANHAIIVMKSMKLLMQNTHLKIQFQILKIAKNSMTKTTLDSILYSSSDSEWLSRENKIIEVKLSNTKYARNFPVTISNNKTICLFHTGATISCMSKRCFDKLDLTLTHTHKVKGANGNKGGPLGITSCTLEFPKKFQPQFIVCKHLLWPIILGLDISHNYLIGIDWFSTKQLHLHQGPWSIVVSDPTPFPLHINQISILPPPHLLVKTTSQIKEPSRTLGIIPTTLTSTPKPDLTGTQSSSKHNLFIVPLLKIFHTILPVHLLCTIINTSPDQIILPKN